MIVGARTSKDAAMTTLTSDTRVIADGLIFPEGPRWRDGRLWFSDIHDKKVKTVDLAGNLEVVVEIPPPNRTSGLGFLPDGRLLIVAAPDKIMRLDPDGLKVVVDLSTLVEFGCNDMVVDSRGNAYVGNLGFDFRAAEPKPATAPLILVKPDGSARIVAEEMGFPNGSVITPDGKTLIVGETNASRYSAFDIGADGSLSNRRVWAQFDDRGFTLEGRSERIRPDGCCLDAEGAIWLASPGRDEVVRALPGGKITHRVKPSQVPYACMLGGPDRKTLFICTAPTHVTRDVIELKRGRIETMAVEVGGVGLP